MTAAPPVGLHYWHCWALRTDGTPAWFAGVQSERYSDREQVAVPEPEALELVRGARASFVDLGPDGAAVGLRAHADSRSGLEGLWFYEVAEDGTPPATVVMVFSEHGVSPGSLQRDGALGDLPVGSGNQLAAVRWYPSSGEVDQIYVAPQARRQGVATELIVSVGMLQAVRRGPRLWGDGQRTDLGEAWVGAHDWSIQAAPRTHVAPPMTPGDHG